MSEQFIPLEERDPMDQARFWARRGRPDPTRAPCSEMDPPEKDIL